MRRLSITALAVCFLWAAVEAQPLVNVKDIFGTVITSGVVVNFPADYPDATVSGKISILISTANALFRAGELIGNTHFDVSGSTVMTILLNAPTDYPDNLAALYLSAILAQLDNYGVVIDTTQVADLKNVFVTNFPSSFTITGDISGSTISVSNFPASYEITAGTVTIDNFPAVQAVSQSGDWEIIKATVVVENPITDLSVNNLPSDYLKDGGSVTVTGAVSVDNFPASVENVWVTSGTISVDNFPTDYATEATLAAVRDGLKNVAITSGTVEVGNLPAVYNVTGSTVTVIQNDTRTYHTAIRNAPDQTDRYLRVNTYNGLDVRLHNSVGTLISSTNPLPVDNYSVWLSSYVGVGSTGTIKSGATDIARVVIGTPGQGSQITIRNGTDGAGAVVAVINTSNDTMPSRVIELGFRLATGLYIEAIGATPAKLTIIYR